MNFFEPDFSIFLLVIPRIHSDRRIFYRFIITYNEFKLILLNKKIKLKNVIPMMMDTRVLYDTDTKINLHSDPRGVMGICLFYTVYPPDCAWLLPYVAYRYIPRL